MKKTLIANAVFLLAAIGLAFFTWTVEEKDEDEAPVLLDIKPEALTRVHYAWPGGELELGFEGEGEGRETIAKLVHEVKKKPKPAEAKPAEAKPDAPTPDEAKPDEAEAEVIEKETAVFPAGRSVARSLERLAPFKVRRSLGVPEAERLETMGLKEPERKLTVEAGPKRIVLEVGAETYGNQGRYARVEGQGEVYLLEPAATSGLEGTPLRLMEARLVGAELQDIVEVEVRVGERRARFVHTDRDQPKKRFFAPKGKESERSEEATGLVSTLRSLRAKSFLAEELPKDASEAAVVVLELAKKSPVEVRLYELADGSGYRAKVGRWLAEVPASRGKNVIEDILAVLPAE